MYKNDWFLIIDYETHLQMAVIKFFKFKSIIDCLIFNRLIPAIVRQENLNVIQNVILLIVFYLSLSWDLFEYFILLCVLCSM